MLTHCQSIRELHAQGRAMIGHISRPNALIIHSGN